MADFEVLVGADPVTGALPDPIQAWTEEKLAEYGDARYMHTGEAIDVSDATIDAVINDPTSDTRASLNATYARVFTVSPGDDPADAYADLVAAGGGELRFLPGTHTDIGLVLDEAVITLVTGRGATIIPESGGTAITFNAGAQSVPPIVLDGITIDGTTVGGSGGTAKGIVINDHYGATVINTKVANLATGILFTGTSYWSESSVLDNVLVDYCLMGIDIQKATGTGSYGYAEWGLVHVDHVPQNGTALRFGSGVTFYHARIGLLLVHTPNTGVTGIDISANLTNSNIKTMLEGSNATTSRTGIKLNTGASVDGMSFEVAFAGTGWATNVSNTPGLAFQFHVGEWRTISAGATSTHVLRSKVLGDSGNRFAIQADGTLNWYSNDGNGTQWASVFSNGSGATQWSATLQVRRDLATRTAFSSVVVGDSQNRYEVQNDGKTRWGPGNASLDTEFSRTAANQLGMSAGDSFKVDGTWNGGTILFGSYYLWVDGSGRLRIKSSAPSSDTDGTVVGTQS